MKNNSFIIQKKIILLFFCLYYSLSFIANGQSLSSSQHVIIAPHCLLAKSKSQYQRLATLDQFSLLIINTQQLNQLIIEKKYSPTNCGGFRDLTRAWLAFSIKNPTTKNRKKAFLKTYTRKFKPTIKSVVPTPTYKIDTIDKINQLFEQLEPQTMWLNLITLTNFEDRYANSSTGVATEHWIIKQVKQLAEIAQRTDVSVYTVKTGEKYKQDSIIVKVGTSLEPGIVIGAHMDTLRAKRSASTSLKPGADDDGSGMVIVLEIARLLFSNQMYFKRPIYFIWYAAEEEGLVGSDYVVAEFKMKKIPISAVMQLDTVGYRYKNDPSIWLMSDNVDKDLTAYLEKLISVYIHQPVKYTRCGYACSDHAVWTQNNYAAAMPSEAAMRDTNPHIHTARDTMDKLCLEHMLNYAKLTLAFTVELAELNS